MTRNWTTLLSIVALCSLGACSTSTAEVEAADTAPDPVITEVESAEIDARRAEHERRIAERSRVDAEVAARLVGDWATEPTLGQLGVTVVRTSFAADGTFASELDFESIPSPNPLRTVGTFRVSGDRVLFTTSVKTTSATFHFDEDALVLDEGNDQIYVFTRR